MTERWRSRITAHGLVSSTRYYEVGGIATEPARRDLIRGPLARLVSFQLKTVDHRCERLNVSDDVVRDPPTFATSEEVFGDLVIGADSEEGSCQCVGGVEPRYFANKVLGGLSSLIGYDDRLDEGI